MAVALMWTALRGARAATLVGRPYVDLMRTRSALCRCGIRGRAAAPTA
ncbi:hypothetical protein J4H86_19445 [Spiractinospora alimapuensis]|nr:hypothetical protein [Spiractinospora alimapuensis]QVQ51005.1 hypothetical protein J4H86_19445 [Spiractinospora alimapuensis]